jgi:hypothetical protein
MAISRVFQFRQMSRFSLVRLRAGNAQEPLRWNHCYNGVVSFGEFPLGEYSMTVDWIPRLRGHAELVQKLAEEVPKALDRPSLTFDHAARLRTVIEKGARDFDEVLQLMQNAEVEETYLQAAERLARTWQVLCDAAEEKVQSLDHYHRMPLSDNDDGVSVDVADDDETEPTNIDRKQ